MKEHLVAKFHDSVDKTNGPDSCWNWKKSLMQKGYGQTWDGHTVVRAHRVAYSLHHGVELTRSQQVLHSCDNRACCNPLHLFIGTNADNMDDKVAKGRQSKGEGTGCAKLTAEQIVEIRTKYAGEVRRKTAEIYGVTPQAISHILCGNRWKHV